MDYISAVNGGVMEYDTRIFDYEWDPVQNAVGDYLNGNS
jgi:hypothetical protein